MPDQGWLPTRGFCRFPLAVFSAMLWLAAVLCFSGPPVRADGGATRTDPDSGISLTLPSGWEFQEDLDGPGEIFKFQRADDHCTHGFVTCWAADEHKKLQTAREHAEELEEWSRQHFNDRFSPVTDTSLAGLPAAAFTETGVVSKFTTVIAVTGGKYLELEFFVSKDQGASHQAEFDLIRNSIRVP